jgi:hypothetical protein
MMDKEQVVAEAVRVLCWADEMLDSTVGEYSIGFDSGFRRGVEHLAEVLVAGSGVYTDWDALVAEAKEGSR